MKTIGKIFAGFTMTALTLFGAIVANGQNTLQFTSVNATPENAIQLHWASNSNEVYEIDCADSLIDTNTGTTTWNTLYENYPSQGTNTFITDCGSYHTSPEIVHPKNSPMRFYRVVLTEANNAPSNPTVTIIAPTNGTTLSDVVDIQVSASSDAILENVKLYIDGEEQKLSDDNSNFVINTCEWLNGNHVLFATAESATGLGGVPNDVDIYYGRSVSSFVNVTFTNLIEELAFSEPFFEPSLGQTQQVSAQFTANCNWTLQIQDVNSNTVRTATGSGASLSFAWDGTGDGETAIPDGVYYYQINATPNGQPLFSQSFSAMSSSALTTTDDSTQPYVEDGGSAVPLAMYPPGFDTNGLTIVEATPSQVQSARTVHLHTLSSGTMQASTFASNGATPNGTGSGQGTRGPTRPPTSPTKNSSGTFGILYRTYSTNGFASAHPATGWPYPLPTLVGIDNQSRTALTVDKRLTANIVEASGFRDKMSDRGWHCNFILNDNKWFASTIKKSSLGGQSIFNTVNFGWMMTHGSLGNNNSTGTEDDNIRYTYIWLGANDYVRLSDMDFGSDGTNGLRWMTLQACNILNPANYTSMNDAGKIPVNDNLHILQGPSTDGFSDATIGDRYATDLTDNDMSIVDSWNDATRTAYYYDQVIIVSQIGNQILKNAAVYWPACFGDKLSKNNPPDPNNGLQYKETQVFP